VLEDGREGSCHDHVEIVADRYRLGPVLRRSADTCAHRAYDELLQRTVRVTLVTADPAAPASFVLRPQGWQDRDPEVAELFDAGREHDRLFLVTHHPDEPTLAETTPPGGLDLGQLRHLGTAVATAQVPRHQRGAAHGGLGAGTVAFTPQGASLAEFGLLPWLARWGDVAVAPPYVAPEQRTGVDPGPASDVYALGRLLTELAPEHGLRPGLRALLAQMTAESPSARPTMAQVQRRLAGRDGLGVTSADGASRRGRRVGLVAAACCLVGSVVGLSAFAGEVPAIGSDGATLAATAAVPAPVIALAPLPPAGSGSTGDAVSDDTASGSTATAAARAVVAHSTSGRSTSTRSTSSGSTPAGTTSDDSPRVVDAAQRTSTDSDDQDGSGSTDRPATPTTTSTPDRSDQGTDHTAAPTRSPATSGRSGSTTTRSGHPARGVLGRISSSLGHHAPSTSGNAGGTGDRATPSTDGTSSTADHPQSKSPDVLDTPDEAP
jgi:serine/threonine-protein kinase